MISRSPKYDCMSAGKLPLAIRGAVAGHAARAPWPLQDLGDMIQGQLKASEGIDVSTIVDLFSDNARRISTGFEPLPEGFPPGPQGESGLELASDPLTFLRTTFKTYGGLATIVIGGERVVLVGDPVVAKQIVEDEPQKWVKEGTAFFPGSSLAGNGLLVSDGDTWRRQRRLSNPAFRTSSVKRYSGAVHVCTQQMISDRWAPTAGRTRDLYADFNQLTLDITLAAVFGQDLSRSSLGSDVGSSVRQAFKHFSQRSANGFIIPEWLPVPDNLQYNAAVHRLDSLIYSLIDERRTEILRRGKDAGVNEAAPDLLEALLVSKDDDGSVMDDQALRDELMTVLVAGQETSAILMGWVCATLAWNPEVQENAAQEIQAVLKGEMPLLEDMDRLPYCAAVVLETLRMHPPAYMIGRCAVVPTSFTESEYNIPSKTTALIAPYLLHFHPNKWDAPEQFSPSRWAASDWKTALSKFGPNGSYLPFGSGPRVCIGTHFAFFEVMVVIVSLLQNFKTIPASTVSPFPVAEPIITLRPREVQVRLLKRA